MTYENKDCSDCRYNSLQHTSRRCHECKPWMPWGKPTDLISRADAIEAVSLEIVNKLCFSTYEAREIATHALSALPSADAVLKHDVEIIIDEITKRTQSAEAVPHGRLIDADALSEKLCKTTSFIKDGEVFQRMIDDAPTVQAEAAQGWRTGKPTESGKYTKEMSESEILMVLSNICTELLNFFDTIEEIANDIKYKGGEEEWVL